MRSNFHKNFGRSLACEMRFNATRKWPIDRISVPKRTQFSLSPLNHNPSQKKAITLILRKLIDSRMNQILFCFFREMNRLPEEHEHRLVHLIPRLDFRRSLGSSFERGLIPEQRLVIEPMCSYSGIVPKECALSSQTT